MSSLLQFSGKVDRHKGVRLQFVLERKEGYKTVDIGPKVLCDICGRLHSQIYTAWRKPAGMFGCWVVFRYLGEEHVPDLSIPIGVPSLPRGAKALSARDNDRAWHS